jgi:hypothetical protein
MDGLLFDWGRLRVMCFSEMLRCYVCGAVLFAVGIGVGKDGKQYVVIAAGAFRLGINRLKSDSQIQRRILA